MELQSNILRTSRMRHGILIKVTQGPPGFQVITKKYCRPEVGGYHRATLPCHFAAKGFAEPSLSSRVPQLRYFRCSLNSNPSDQHLRGAPARALRASAWQTATSLAQISLPARMRNRDLQRPRCVSSPHCTFRKTDTPV